MMIDGVGEFFYTFAGLLSTCSLNRWERDVEL